MIRFVAPAYADEIFHAADEYEIFHAADDESNNAKIYVWTTGSLSKE